jgi:putative flippase GtrA
VTRGPKRELISRAYNLILRLTLRNGFSDAQCGFKAVRTDVARRLLPLVEDNGWFFDTELLVLAEHNALRIHEVPVDWVDDPDSRVDVVRTAREDLRGVIRVAAAFARGQGRLAPGDAGPDRADRPAGGWGPAIHFAAIGGLSTVAFAILFAALFHPLGALGADVLALVACAVANVAANRRFTFAARGRGGRRRHYGAGLALSLLPLAFTLVALAAMGSTGLGAALAVVTVANLAAGAVRFELLRRWVFRS